MQLGHWTWMFGAARLTKSTCRRVTYRNDSRIHGYLWGCRSSLLLSY